MKNDRTPFVSLALALLLAAATAVPARAQYSQAYYHLLGDTIYLDSPRRPLATLIPPTRTTSA